MSGLGVLSVLPEDIWEKILQEMEKTLTMLKVSKGIRELIRKIYVPLVLRENHRERFRHQIAPIVHWKIVLRGAARLFSTYRPKVEGAHHYWSYPTLICKHHGDCGHHGGHMFDLLELWVLVQACPGFRIHHYGQAPEPCDVYFTLVVQSYNADAWRVELKLTRNPRRIVQESLNPNFAFINGEFFE
jgi:hypothetical protein